MKFFLVLLFSVFSLFILHAQKKPNIILIVADDLGYGDVGCYGQQKIETPNINKLAKEGVRFNQFYAGTAVCAPSRASLMTGQHTGHTPVRGNKGTQPEGQTPLPDSTVTFVNHLQKAGYTTAAFGKWGLGYITTTGAPDKKGFDQFFGYNCQTLAHNYYPDHLWNNHQRVDLPGNLKYDSAYSADMIQQQAVSFLREKHNKPFFIFLPYTLPHGDVISPHDSVYNYYIKKFNEQPLAQRPSTYTNLKRTFEPYPHAAFASMVSRLDRYVGEIVTTLKERGELENTLILFTSDNGPHRENGGDPDFFDSNGKFRGIKRDLYEGGIRVPFIAYWKSKIKPAITNQPASFWDLYPTFLEMAGISATKTIDGISILSSLTGKGKQKQHEYFYWEFHENNGRQAVRWKNWKGVKLNVGKDANAPLELYDLTSDPGEQNNVATKYPAIVKRIEQIIKEAHSPNKDWPLFASER
ncbi:MAG TPA: arylsulfatase [Chitinophagaceae bacterium]